MSFDEAYKFIKNKRKSINMNPSFKRQIISYFSTYYTISKK